MNNNSTGNPKWIRDCAICGYALYEGMTHNCGTAPKNITLNEIPMRITIDIIEKNLIHTRLSIWVNGGLICNPAGICLRNEEVGDFIQRLTPDDVRDRTPTRPSSYFLSEKDARIK